MRDAQIRRRLGIAPDPWRWERPLFGALATLLAMAAISLLLAVLAF